MNANPGDSIFLSCGKQNEIEKILSLARNKIAQELNLIDNESICILLDCRLSNV